MHLKEQKKSSTRNNFFKCARPSWKKQKIFIAEHKRSPE